VPFWRRPLRRPTLPQLGAGLGWACALALAVILIAPGPPSTQPVQPRVAVDTGPSCAVVSSSVEQLARDQIPVERARELWRHLVHCDDCFDAYRQAWQAVHRSAQRAAIPQGRGAAIIPGGLQVETASASGGYRLAALPGHRAPLLHRSALDR
jgi:hypothetical protein